MPLIFTYISRMKEVIVISFVVLLMERSIIESVLPRSSAFLVSEPISRIFRTSELFMEASVFVRWPLCTLFTMPMYRHISTFANMKTTKSMMISTLKKVFIGCLFLFSTLFLPFLFVWPLRLLLFLPNCRSLFRLCAEVLLLFADLPEPLCLLCLFCGRDVCLLCVCRLGVLSLYEPEWSDDERLPCPYDWAVPCVWSSG